MSTNARQLIDDNATVLETFVMKYLLDNGIGAQYVEIIAKELFGQVVDSNAVVSEDVASTPRELLSAAIQDVVKVGVFSDPEFDLERVVKGAVSLELLVRYAHKLNSAVMPPEVIPSDEVVNAALELFHASHQPVNS